MKAMDSSDEDEFIRCKVCDVKVTGGKPYRQHLQGKKHQKRLKLKSRLFQLKSLDGGAETLDLEETEDSEAQDFSCEICEMVFTGIIPYSQHLRSRSHMKALRREKFVEGSTKDSNVNSNFELPSHLNDMIKDIVPEPFESCSMCDKQFSGPTSYYQHLKSRSHLKRKRELELLREIKTERNSSKSLCEKRDSKQLHSNKDRHLEEQGPAPAAEHDEEHRTAEQDSASLAEQGEEHCQAEQDFASAGEQDEKRHLAEQESAPAAEQNEEHRSVEQDSAPLIEQHEECCKAEQDFASAVEQDKECHLAEQDSARAAKQDKKCTIAKRDSAHAVKQKKLKCKECKKSFNDTASFAQHLTSKAHEKKQSLNKLTEQLRSIKVQESDDYDCLQPGEAESDIVPSIDMVIASTTRSVTLSRAENAEDHLKSKGHQKAIKSKSHFAPKYKFNKQSGNSSTNLAKKSDDDEVDSGAGSSGDETDSSTGSSDAQSHGNEDCESKLTDYDEECTSDQEVGEKGPVEDLDESSGNRRSVGRENSKVSHSVVSREDDEASDNSVDTAPSESGSMKSEDGDAIASLEEPNGHHLYGSNTGSSDALSHGNEDCESELTDYDEECTSDQEEEENVPVEDLYGSSDNCQSVGGENSKVSHSVVSRENDEEASNNSVDTVSSESASVKSEDGDATISSEESKGDESFDATRRNPNLQNVRQTRSAVPWKRYLMDRK